MRLHDPALADEFDRTLAIYFREWEDEREEYRLKKVLSWALGGTGTQSGRRESCSHPHESLKPDSSGGMYCSDCGTKGIY